MYRLYRIFLHFTAIAVISLQWSGLSAQEATSMSGRKKARKEAASQRPDPTQQRYKVEGGVMVKTGGGQSGDTPTVSDSTGVANAGGDGKLAADSAGIAQTGKLPSDSLAVAPKDSTGSTAGLIIPDSLNLTSGQIPGVSAGDSLNRAELSNRDLRRLERAERKADSTLNHHYFFRDSIPISRLTAMSIAIPGLAQFYNKQPWKIPILYGTVAAGIFFGIKESKNYSFYKKQYDILVKAMPPRPTAGPQYNPAEFARWRAAIDPIQDKMIRYNTNRQILFGGALASYIYFIGDGAVNYPGQLTKVKKATTLSTICPGAGQIYNGSYWKVPIVVGGIATFAYVIDWNNRGYQRFKLAYDLINEAEKNGTDRIDEFKDYPNLGKQQIKRYKDSYRRNRDLCIILACGFYVLNIIDAHVDAQLRDYDVSDDLSFMMGPSITPLYVASTGNSTNVYGLSLGLKF